MAEQAARNKRAASASTLIENIRELQRYKDKGNVSKRLLEQKLNNVIEAKNNLVAMHHIYAEKANKELDEEEMLTYLRPKLDESNDIIDVACLLIEDLEEEKEKEKLLEKTTASTEKLWKKQAYELTVAELQVDNDEKTLRGSIQKMMEIIGNPDKLNRESGMLVQALLKEIDSLLEQQIKSWNPACNRLAVISGLGTWYLGLLSGESKS